MSDNKEQKNVNENMEETTANLAEFPEFDESNKKGFLGDNKLDFLKDLQLNIYIELGRTKMRISDILDLERGYVIELEKLASEPVDVYVNNKKIAEGEVKQLMSIGDLNLSKEAYFDVITNKTAVLFSGACRCSARIANSDKKIEDSLASFGLHLGKAFQIFDDYLDYAGNSNDLGKNIGDDLAEGKLTLPLIEALRLTSNSKEHHIICNSIKENSNANIERVIEICNDTGALNNTLDMAKNEAKNAKKALENLPKSIYLNALNDIVDQAVSRKN